MSRTRTQLRQGVVKQLGLPFITGTTTAHASGQFTDANLGLWGDDELAGAYGYMVGDTITDRRITGNTQSTGVATMRPATDLGANRAYELIPAPPTAIHNALNASLLHCFKMGWASVPTVYNHWLTGSPLMNSSFHYWVEGTSANIVPEGWGMASGDAKKIVTVYGNNDATAAAYNPVGVGGVNLASGSTTLNLDPPYRRYLSDLQGERVKMRAWAWHSTASNLRVQLRSDDASATTIVNSDYHPGDSTWKVISSAEATISEGVITPRVRLQGTGSYGAVWFDTGKRARVYPMPSQLFPNGPREVTIARTDIDETNKQALIHEKEQRVTGWRWREAVQQEGAAGYTASGTGVPIGELHLDVPSGYLMRLVGDSPFILPEADGDKVQVSEWVAPIIEKQAAIFLLQGGKLQANLAETRRLGEVARQLREDIEALVDEGRSTDEHASLPLGIFL